MKHITLLSRKADTRMLLHAADCCKDVHKRVMIRTVDTDVLVIAVSLFHKIGAEKLWLEFSTGKHTRYISVHGIVHALGTEKAESLIAFHALTGCDQTSFFPGEKRLQLGKHGNIFQRLLPLLKHSATLLMKESFLMSYLHWNGLSFLCMTEPAPQEVSMKQGSTSLQRKEEQLMLYHQHQMRYCNMSKDLHIKQVMSRPSH